MAGPSGWQWHMVQAREPLVRVDVEAFEAAADEVVVEVAGCGVCHTDIGFLHEGVRTRHELPLTLGHEVSGTVVAASAGHEGLVGKAVVVPAVMPCGSCDACRKGRGNICAAQQMPGNDRHGGFASHVVVPALGLCEVPVRGKGQAAQVGELDLGLPELAVMADAVTTPYQAAMRAGIEEGDLAIVVGLGGVGTFCAQIAAAKGAKVLGIEPDEERRRMLDPWCEVGTLDPRRLDGSGLRKRVREMAKAAAAPKAEWKIFECSGSAKGQETAFGLVGFGATLSVVGFTLDKLELRLSNLMAFDARAIGTWGCVPELYPEALALILDGKLEIGPFVELSSDQETNEVLARVHGHKSRKRPVLVPAHS